MFERIFRIQRVRFFDTKTIDGLSQDVLDDMGTEGGEDTLMTFFLRDIF